MKKRPLFGCEEFKVLKVIGEDVVQVVTSTEDILWYGAQAVLKVDVDLLETTDHVFTNKIVKQGTLQLRIQYCSRCSVKRCQLVEVPFLATAEILGIRPDLELNVQNKLLIVETDYRLLDPYTIEVKVAAEISIKASQYVQRRLRVCHTNVISHSLISDC